MILKTYEDKDSKLREEHIEKFKNVMKELITQKAESIERRVRYYEAQFQYQSQFENIWKITSKIMDNYKQAWDITIILNNEDIIVYDDEKMREVDDDSFLLALSKKIPHALQAYYTATQTKANVCVFDCYYQRCSYEASGMIPYHLSRERVKNRIGVQTSSQTWYKPAKSSYQGVTISDADIIDAMADLFFKPAKQSLSQVVDNLLNYFKLLSTKKDNLLSTKKDLTPSKYLTILTQAPTLSIEYDGINAIDDIKTIDTLKFYADPYVASTMVLYQYEEVSLFKCF